MGDNKFRRNFVLVFCLSTILFFRPIQISEQLLYYTFYFLFLITSIIVVFSYKTSSGNTYIFPMLLLLLAELISGFSAVYSWGQSIMDSLIALTPSLSYILFILLLIWKFKTKNIEMIFVILASCYIVAFAISFLIYPLQVFGGNGYGDERGFQRIAINGSGYLFLLSFYSLNQYFIKKNINWLFVYAITLVFIIMTLSRMLITVSLLLSTLYFLRKSSLIKRIVSILILSFCMYMVSNISFVKNLIDITNKQQEQKEDDIRVQSANFYINDFSPNLFSRIFGNGIPYKESQYSESVKRYEDDYGYYISDIGWIGLYTKFGLLALLAYIIIIYKTFKIAVPEKYVYTKYFLYFVFIISIIIDAPFNNNFIPSIVFALYIVSIQDNSNLKNNSFNKLKSHINYVQFSDSHSCIQKHLF